MSTDNTKKRRLSAAIEYANISGDAEKANERSIEKNGNANEVNNNDNDEEQEEDDDDEEESDDEEEESDDEENNSRNVSSTRENSTSGTATPTSHVSTDREDSVNSIQNGSSSNIDNSQSTDKTTRTKRNKKKKEHVGSIDHLAITQSLGYQIFRKQKRKSWLSNDDELLKKLVFANYIKKFRNKEKKESDNETDEDIIKKIKDSSIKINSDEIDWDSIATSFEIRKPKDCKKRWCSSLDPSLRKGKWTATEDELLLNAYKKYGPIWQQVAVEIPGRTEDQCSKRYIEVLNPETKDRLKPWSLEEDLQLIEGVKNYGTKWRTVSSAIKGRPSLTCRNRWRKIMTDIAKNHACDEIVNAVILLDKNGHLNSQNLPENIKAKLIEKEKLMKVDTNDDDNEKSQSQQQQQQQQQNQNSQNVSNSKLQSVETLNVYSPSRTQVDSIPQSSIRSSIEPSPGPSSSLMDAPSPLVNSNNNNTGSIPNGSSSSNTTGSVSLRPFSGLSNSSGLLDVSEKVYQQHSKYSFQRQPMGRSFSPSSITSHQNNFNNKINNNSNSNEQSHNLTDNNSNNNTTPSGTTTRMEIFHD
ncbi:unnamed protein product [[Candida] boidinii]|nr:unnamed protein product [[Candida] boidinii]